MKPEPDEIDRIMTEAIGSTIFGYVHENDTPNNWGSSLAATEAVRAALKAAGFAIVLDEAQLLEKGAGVKLKP